MDFDDYDSIAEKLERDGLEALSDDDLVAVVNNTATLHHLARGELRRRQLERGEAPADAEFAN